MPASTIAELINAHRAAVLADEASYDDDGVAIDEATAEASGEAESRAYEALVAAMCLTPDDVAAKISYFLEPPVGNRECNLNALIGVDGESWDPRTGPSRLSAFMRSLRVPS